MSEDKEVKIKREKIMQLLKELEEKTDLEATAVVTREGMRLACSVSAEMDADIFSAAAAAMVNLGSMTIRKLKQGNLKEVIIKGDQGYTIVTEADDKTMLVAAGRQSFRLGYYLGVLKKYAKDIAQILKSIKIPLEKMTESGVIAATHITHAPSVLTARSETKPIEETTTPVDEVKQPIKEVKEESAVDEKSALEAERKAILEALKALGWEESASE
ncbi:MAG: roadblock/LC7 domain-containing protein [Candidatus Odinarchaeia archaeon]